MFQPVVGSNHRPDRWGAGQVHHAGERSRRYFHHHVDRVAGALLATFIGSHVGLYQEGQRAGFIMSLLGAIILLGSLPPDQGQDGHYV